MTIHVFFVNMQVVKIEQKHSEYLENISEWFVNSEQNISFYLFLLLLFFFRSKQMANIAKYYIQRHASAVASYMS